jgi:hypothetical protein
VVTAAVAMIAPVPALCVFERLEVASHGFISRSSQ